MNAKTAIQTCTQLPEEDMAILALRLKFGGPPCPYEWGVVLESIRDLSISIIQDANWDPSQLQDPNGCHVTPSKILYESITFAEGRELIVDVPVDARGIVDVYIDDTIDLTVDIENSNNVKRLEQETLLAIHCDARDKNVNDPIPM